MHVHLLPWSFNQFPATLVNISVMMVLNCSTELFPVIQSIISYTEMVKN